MSEHESKEAIIAKIRKLLALAKSSNVHEAELAAERASKLMEKWRVSAASVQELDDIKSGREKIVTVAFEVPNCKMKYKWLETLGLACAVLFDGTILVNARLHGTSWTWVGFEKEIPLMQDLFLHLWSCYPGIAEHDLNEAKRQRTAHIPEEIRHLANFTPAETMKFKLGHGQGFAISLLRRCDTLAKQRKQQMQVTNTCTALVLVRDGALTEWKEKNGIRTVKRVQKTGDAGGFASGYARGQNIALGGQLHG